MKALIIGGTGNISQPITQKLLDQGWQVSLLNRGSREEMFPQAEQITVDANKEEETREKLAGRTFDVVAQFIAYKPEDIARDIRLYSGKTAQYIFISSASVYQKPLRGTLISESTPLHNPYWQYSRDKIACEALLKKAYDSDFFPFTIVRPSHTYGPGYLPLAVRGDKGPWQVVDRMMKRKPVLIPGDGTSLWTVTWAEDFADGFIGLMGNDHAIGEAVHLTSDEALSWNQIYRILAEALGVPFIPCHVPSDLLAAAKNYDFIGGLLGDKAHSVVFDNSKLKRLVPGFCAATRFDQGARLSLAHLMEHPELQVPDPEFDAFSDRVVDIMRHAEDEIAAI